MDLPRRLNGRDLPRFQERVSHLGWEIRTKHFVVVATTSRQDAIQTAQVMATAWENVGTLADQWTDLHRRENFGIAAVGVWVIDGGRRSREPARGRRKATEFSEPADTVFIDLSDGLGSIEDRTTSLRRKSVDAFFHVNVQEQALPQWVRSGVADYIATADEQPSFQQVQALEPPGHNAGAQDTTQSALWVRYLLEADEGRHAPRFFEAMATATANAARTVYQAQQPRQTAGPFEQLTATPENLVAANEWLRKGESDQQIQARSASE